MCPSLGVQVGLDDDDDVQRLRELFVPQLRLVQAGLDVSCDSGLFEILLWPIVVIELAAKLAMRTATA